MPDAENRLLEVNELGIITSFVYDGDGGRVKKGLSPQGTVPEQWIVYIGSLFEKDSSGKTTKHIFLGANRICAVESTGGRYFYHSDHLGSSNVVTNSTGLQVGLTEFTPYGSVSKQTGTYEPKHKFTGKELDSTTGLYFYGARYYDPELGRFITADSIVQAPYDPQSLNRYSYCRNNPLNYIDPTGHWSWKKFWHSAVGAVLGVALAIVLGPAGLGMSAAMAGMWGGMAGGALIGGLEGGWKGALIGAGMGAAFGFAAGGIVDTFGAFGVGGLLAGGAAYAGATNSWDSFAGGITGGLAGTAIGNGINSSWNEFTGSGQEGVNRNDLAAQTQQLKQSQQALDVKLDEEIQIGSRDAIGPADHMLIKRENGMFVEAGAGNDGKMTVFQYNPKDYINPASRVNLAPTQKHSLSAFYEGKLHLQWSYPTPVSSVKLNNLISGYQNIWSGAVYAAGSNNSNNFVNTCVYGAGGHITGLNTLRPSFSTYRDDR